MQGGSYGSNVRGRAPEFSYGHPCRMLIIMNVDIHIIDNEGMSGSFNLCTCKDMKCPLSTSSESSLKGPSDRHLHRRRCMRASGSSTWANASTATPLTCGHHGA